MDRRNLLDEFNTVAVPVDPLREPAERALDTVQTFLSGSLEIVPYAPNRLPGGPRKLEPLMH